MRREPTSSPDHGLATLRVSMVTVGLPRGRTARAMAVDILAFGPHPDDAEIGCGGLLLKMKSLGHTTGIVDMTRGDMGWGTPEERDAECDEAARGSCSSTCARTSTWATAASRTRSRTAARSRQVIRKHRPQIVFAPYYNLPIGRGLGHNDHFKTGVLVVAGATTSRTCASARSRASRTRRRPSSTTSCRRDRRPPSSSTSPTTSRTGSRRSRPPHAVLQPRQAAAEERLRLLPGLPGDLRPPVVVHHQRQVRPGLLLGDGAEDRRPHGPGPLGGAAAVAPPAPCPPAPGACAPPVGGGEY